MPQRTKLLLQGKMCMFQQFYQLQNTKKQEKEKQKVKRAARRKLFKARKLQAKYFIQGKYKHSENCMYSVLMSSFM
jgi:hypothetical protein